MNLREEVIEYFKKEIGKYQLVMNHIGFVILKLLINT